LHLPTSQEGRYSQSLERGLAILRAFTPERTWMGIAEIAQHLEMSRPTTHRYASTLVALNYLEQGRGRKYRLGMRAGDPGRAAIASTRLRVLPSALLAGLRDRSGCTASLAVLDGADIVYVDRARSAWQGPAEVSARIGRGSRLPARDTAMGRVLLAGLSEEDLRTTVGRVGNAGRGADRTKLLAELERVRHDGFAIAEQLRVEDQLCVAAAIGERPGGAAVAAVEVACAIGDGSTDDARERLAPLVCDAAREMSEQLERRHS
jgi:IclR family transcriptional regulator, pca regulon regulatory protein